MIARELLEKLCENLITAFENDGSILDVDDIAFMKEPSKQENGFIIIHHKDQFQFFIVTVQRGKIVTD